MTPDTAPGVLPGETRIGRTALRVTDLAATTQFYRDVVGLAVLEHTDTNASLGVGETPLLVLAKDDTAPERPSDGTGLFHTAFSVPTRAALGDALARIREYGQLDGASDHDVSEALYLADPEGNGVEIYRDLPRDEWTLTDDGRVQIGTSPLDLGPITAAAAGHSDAPAGTAVGHIHLEVSSLEAFRDFYVDVVGFEVQTTLPDAVFVAAGGYHHHIGANTWYDRSEPADYSGLAWFEVLLPTTDSLDELRARIEDTEYSVIETGDGFSVAGPDEIEVRFSI